jgi:tetratricopeptide (TPR) repeat protein
MPKKAPFLSLILFPAAASLAFAAGQGPRDLADPSYKNEVLRKVGNVVENQYVLADRAEEFADEFRAKCASGAYASLVEPKAFAARVTADLAAITHDKHLNFRVVESSDAGEQAVSPLHHPVRYARLREKENTGFSKLEWVEPEIGYLELRRFYSFDQARELALGALRFLANARAIIIDVRENGGGSGDYLSSYFLPYPTQLSGLYTRADDALTESWTRRDIGMEPRTDVPVFILIGPRTFSAAEAFAYDMQSRKRATIIGQPSGGGAHNVDLFRIDDRFELYLSTGRSVSPVTGGNWEGTGVIPDVPAEPGAALDTAMALARKAGEEYDRLREARVKKAVDEMQADLDLAVSFSDKGREEEAATALGLLFQTARSVGFLSEFFVEVLAYNYRSGENNAMLFGILNQALELFPRSSELQALLAAGHYSAGNKELALRHFKKALELDPDNRKAASMIQKLEKGPRKAPDIF